MSARFLPISCIGKRGASRAVSCCNSRIQYTKLNTARGEGRAMGQHLSIGAAHWVYLAGVAVIVLTMILRANVVVPSVAATFLVTLAWTHSPVTALGSIFNASFTAAKELFNIFLVIALMTALLNALKTLRSDIRMVEPFRAVMKNGTMAYFVLAAITYVIAVLLAHTGGTAGVGRIAAGGDCRR